jgi:hypothetical protein
MTLFIVCRGLETPRVLAEQDVTPEKREREKLCKQHIRFPELCGDLEARGKRYLKLMNTSRNFSPLIITASCPYFGSGVSTTFSLTI